MTDPTIREALAETREALVGMAREHVAVSIGLGILAGELVYKRCGVRAAVRRAIGWEPTTVGP